MGSQALEKIRIATALILGLTLISCSSKFLRYEKEEQLKQIDEFDNKVKIEIPTEEPAKPAGDPAATRTTAPIGSAPVDVSTLNQQLSKNPKQVSETNKSETQKAGSPKKEIKKNLEPTKTAGKTKKGKPEKRQPELEDAVGFEGRRPLKDPFRVGEKVVHAVDYYKVSAGHLTLAVKPFAKVNGQRSYNFEIGAKTSDWYSGIYRVEDRVNILMDFETMVPSVYTLHVKETSQLKEARMLFEGKKATYWEKRVTDKSGVEEKKQNWDIEEYTQSLYSAAFYVRAFTWDVGKEVAFRVADDNENMIFKGQAVRKERLKTKAGEFDTIVIKPQVELKGKFKQSGDIFMWLSDDDRKYVLRIEAKIKIGSLVSEAIEIQPGQP